MAGQEGGCSLAAFFFGCSTDSLWPKSDRVPAVVRTPVSQEVSPYVRYGVQLLGTLLILAFVPTNLGKAAAFLVLWAFTFRRLSMPEAVFGASICVFFTAMNAATLQQGVFAFTDPDFLGMPVYELFMWGFYLLHVRRVIGGSAPGDQRPLFIWILAALYAAAFGLISDPQWLFWATATLLLVGLARHHTRRDFAFVGYMILLGALIEYVGVHSGHWYYPDDPPGGVPVWFVTLWGGVGFFLHRLALPLIERFERAEGGTRRPA